MFPIEIKFKIYIYNYWNNLCIYFVEVFINTCKVFGGVDILFNNAGVLRDCQWEKEIDTNLVNMFYLYSCLVYTLWYDFTDNIYNYQQQLQYL